MTAIKILELVPLVQSVALAEENLKFAKQKDKDAADFAKVGVKNIVGIEIIKLESDIIGSL